MRVIDVKYNFWDFLKFCFTKYINPDGLRINRFDVIFWIFDKNKSDLLLRYYDRHLLDIDDLVDDILKDYFKHNIVKFIESDSLDQFYLFDNVKDFLMQSYLNGYSKIEMLEMRKKYLFR